MLDKVKKFNQFMNESYYGEIKKWYRGADSKYDLGSSPDSWVWITENPEHAKEYGDNVVEYDFDYAKYENQIVFNEMYDLLVEYAKLNKKEIDDYIFEVKWEPTVDFIQFLKSKEYIGYHFEAEGGSRLCIFYRELLKDPVKFRI